MPGVRDLSLIVSPPSRAGVGLRSERGPILLALMVSTGLIAIDATILATAVPSIVRDIGGYTQFPWLFSVYLLAQTVSVSVYAKLADTFGRKPLLLFGIGLFLVGQRAVRGGVEHARAHRVPRAAGPRRGRGATDDDHRRGRHLHGRRARHRPGLHRERVGAVVGGRPDARRRVRRVRAVAVDLLRQRAAVPARRACSSRGTSARPWSAASTTSTTSAPSR